MQKLFLSSFGKLLPRECKREDKLGKSQLAGKTINVEYICIDQYVVGTGRSHNCELISIIRAD